MLSPPDADLARRDPSLRGLALLLDPAELVEALQPFFPETELREGRLTYVRYKPGSSCLAAYRVDVGSEPALLYAKTYGRDAETKLRKRGEKAPARGTSGPGRILLSERGTVACLFPNDLELGVLRELADPASFRDRLRRMMPGHPELWEGSLRTLAYKPERRYVAELSSAGGAKAVLKFYDETGYRAARAGFRAFAARGPLRLARRIGQSSRRKIMAFEWLPGRLLIDAISGPRPDPGAAAAAGRALAVLHSQRPKHLTSIPRKAEGERLLGLAAGIGFLHPSAAATADSLARRLARSLVELPPEGGPVHGDFYADQVLIDGDAAGILDLDRARRGDAASDLGLFLAHLARDVLRGRISAAAAQAARERFLAGYGETTRLPVARKVALYEAAGLFGLSMDPFRLREPDWPERIEALLSGAGAILADCGQEQPFFPAHPGPSGAERNPAMDAALGEPHGPEQDAEMPFLSEAVDPAAVGPLFTRRLPDLARGGLVRVLAARVVRHKKGRRCLIEYEVRLERAGAPPERLVLFGKVRAKGTDRTSVHLLRELRMSGFGDDSEDGISVPEPVGVVEEFRMWLQRKAPGVPATRLLPEPGGVRLAGRIAEAIHKVHRAGAAARRRHTMADELRILHERLDSTAAANPRWADRLDRVLSACDRLAASVPEPVPCGIHRDFYADQVLVDGDRIFLVDFDLYCEGDPALDAGNFVGHLTEQALRTFGDADALVHRERALEERFLQLAGERCRAGVRAYAVLTLARHIWISTQIPARDSVTEPLLSLVEHRLGVTGGRRKTRAVRHCEGQAMEKK